MKKKGQIGIIGAGLGGLSSAIYLATAGFQVTIFEKNSYAGGKAGNLAKNGFRFDTGPSLLTMPFILQEIFEQNNETAEEHIIVKRLKTTCKYFYSDGSIINAYSSSDEFAQEIELKTSDNADSVKKYLDHCRDIYDLTSDLFLFNPKLNLKTFLSFKGLKSVANISKVDPFRTMHQANQSFFNDSRTIQLFDRYATYNGSNPYQAPATLNIIPYVELSLGSYIVEGGITTLTTELKRLAEKKGVIFNFNQSVEKILTKENIVTGIRSNEENHFFDAVVSNADVSYTYNQLLNFNLKNENDPSLSGIVFYWGVKGTFPSLEIHNILFSENYKKEFDDIFKFNKCPDDPSVYIYISSKYKGDDAPKGYENWFVMVNAPYDKGQDWNKEIRKLRERVIKKIKSILGIDLTGKIYFEEILSPPEIELKTGSLHGCIYGSSSNNRNAAFRRHPAKSKYFKNLFFCGGSVHPGGGIPLVLLSGKHASELINRNLK